MSKSGRHLNNEVQTFRIYQTPSKTRSCTLPTSSTCFSSCQPSERGFLPGPSAGQMPEAQREAMLAAMEAEALCMLKGEAWSQRLGGLTAAKVQTAPWARVTGRSAQGCRASYVQGWAVHIMHHALGSRKHALGMSGACSHASTAPCIKCFVRGSIAPPAHIHALLPRLCLCSHQHVNASPHISCTHAPALSSSTMSLPTRAHQLT